MRVGSVSRRSFNGTGCVDMAAAHWLTRETNELHRPQTPDSQSGGLEEAVERSQRMQTVFRIVSVNNVLLRTR